MIESWMQPSNQWGHFAHSARSILILCSQLFFCLLHLPCTCWWDWSTSDLASPALITTTETGDEGHNQFM